MDFVYRRASRIRVGFVPHPCVRTDKFIPVGFTVLTRLWNVRLPNQILAMENTRKQPKPQCEHKATVRVGTSNLERCANEDCRRVRYRNFEPRGTGGLMKASEQPVLG